MCLYCLNNTLLNDMRVMWGMQLSNMMFVL